jgi:uncharacterized protein
MATSRIAIFTNSYEPPAHASAFGPVLPNERIQGIDLLRGWAMFGVLWSNLNDWYGTRDPVTSLDRGLAWAQGWLIESRFYFLLCVLFGAGFAIQLTRANERGRDIRTTYYRRTLGLLGIGLAHTILLWNGDILTMYALVAFALILFRTAAAKQALASVAVLWLVVPEIITRLRWFAGLRYMVPRESRTTADWILGHGDWMQVAHVRFSASLDWYGRWGLMLYPAILGAFLLGYWAVKSGFLTRVVSDPRVTRRLLYWAGGVALLSYASDIWLRGLLPHAVLNAGPGNPRFWIPGNAINAVAGRTTEASSLAYAALLLLAWQTARGSRLLRPLAATGRMALTTYLVQSVVCTLLFYGYGLGLYGTLTHTGMFALTIILFGLQMAGSTWWLRRFEFGPAEWLWRRMTYGSAAAVRATRSGMPEAGRA